MLSDSDHSTEDYRPTSFFDLPSEIRLQIAEILFEDHVIHFQNAPQRCLQHHTEEHMAILKRMTSRRDLHIPGRAHLPISALPSLIFANRKTYTELRPVFVRLMPHATLSFPTSATLAKYLLSHSFSTISSLTSVHIRNFSFWWARKDADRLRAELGHAGMLMQHFPLRAAHLVVSADDPGFLERNWQMTIHLLLIALHFQTLQIVLPVLEKHDGGPIRGGYITQLVDRGYDRGLHVDAQVHRCMLEVVQDWAGNAFNCVDEFLQFCPVNDPKVRNACREMDDATAQYFHDRYRLNFKPAVLVTMTRPAHISPEQGVQVFGDGDRLNFAAETKVADWLEEEDHRVPESVF